MSFQTDGVDHYECVVDEDDVVVRKLGKRIKQLRRSMGWSQDRLAAEAHVHRNYLGGVERGERNPTVTSIARIAKALEVPIAALFDDTDDDG